MPSQHRSVPKPRRAFAAGRRILALGVTCLTLLVPASTASAKARRAVATTGPTTPPADFFPIGVYRQPTSSYDVWQSRFINTVVDMYDNPAWMEQFNAAAVAHRFWMVRNPRKDIAADKGQPYLLAWTHADEPDVNNVSVAKVQKEYRAWKRADPTRPVITNFAASTIIYQVDSLADQTYRDYMKGTDWVSSDVYPLAAWGEAGWIDNNASPDPKGKWYHTGAAWNAGNGVDKVREISGGKHQFAYIETSDQNLAWPASKTARAPTPDEFRGEVWDAIIHGAKGIVYFPFTFPNKPDGTPKLVAREMTRVNKLITSLAPVITSSPNGDAQSLKLSGGLEGTWRTLNGVSYYFVLNFSHKAATNVAVDLGDTALGSSAVTALNESRTLSLTGDTLTDSFAPYELHVYTTDVAVNTLARANAAVAAAVPEPASLGLAAFATAMVLGRRPRRGTGRRACRVD